MAVPPNGSGNGNGAITEKSRVSLALAIAAVLACVSASAAYFTLLARVAHLEEHTTDRYTGADADRLAGRIQWAWQDFAARQGMECYPRVPNFRASVPYEPSVIWTQENSNDR